MTIATWTYYILTKTFWLKWDFLFCWLYFSFLGMLGVYNRACAFSTATSTTGFPILAWASSQHVQYSCFPFTTPSTTTGPGGT